MIPSILGLRRRGCRAAAVALLLGGCAGQGTDAPSALESWRATNASVHEGLAEAALARGRPVEACASAREALRIDPSRANAAVLLARSELARGSLADAESAGARAVESDSGSAQAWFAFAECAAAAGRAGDAEARYQRALELGSADAAIALGAARLERGDVQGAAALLERDGLPPEAPALLASHHWLAGQGDQAARVLDAALLRSPNDRGLAEKRARLRTLLEGAAGASTEATSSPERALAEAAAELRGGDAARAAALYRDQLAAAPDDDALRIALAEALRRSGDRPGAAAALRSVLQRDPRSSAALAGLARIRLDAGEPAEAARLLEEAVAADPTRPALRALLAAACSRAGDLARARAAAAAVAELDPGGSLDLACRRMLDRAEHASEVPK